MNTLYELMGQGKEVTLYLLYFTSSLVVVFHKMLWFFWTLQVLLQRWLFYLPGVCTHTDIERKQSPENILKSSKKHNI